VRYSVVICTAMAFYCLGYGKRRPLLPPVTCACKQSGDGIDYRHYAVACEDDPATGDSRLSGLTGVPSGKKPDPAATTSTLSPSPRFDEGSELKATSPLPSPHVYLAHALPRPPWRSRAQTPQGFDPPYPLVKPVSRAVFFE